MTCLIILILIALLILFILAPSRKCRRADPWRGTAFAHRGLHGGEIPENSLEAFDAACRAGFGIELDVQLSKDGCVVVFHDDTLVRMTGDPRRVDETDLSDLRALRLDGKAQIPTFEEVLARVAGRVPLLVEIKNGKRNAELCEKTVALLKKYDGAYVTESFNPLILRWLKKNAPEIIRGQLVGPKKDYLESDFSLWLAAALSTLSLNFLARPDFVAYDVSLRFAAPRIQRALFRTPMAAWTVRDEATFRACKDRGEMPIFEGFLPKQ